ncbi:MAG: hypothetical protein WCX23_00090 [Candidatus Paceibacterota bacterium]|jgi:hypothetical protein
MSNNEKPILLLTVIFFLGAAAIFFYLVFPLYSGKDGFLEKERTFKIETEKLANLKNYNSDLKKTYQDLKDNKWEEAKKEIDVNFSSNDPMFLPKMYSFFQQRCLANGLYLDSIIGSVSQESGASAERVKKNQFSLSLSGSYASFKNLLADMESQILMASVENLDFSVQSSFSSGSKEEKNVSGSMPFGLRISVPSY